MAVNGTRSGARVSVTARITTPPVAPKSLDVALSSTGKPITSTALAPAAAIECDAPRRNVAVPPGVSSVAASRAVGETVNMISQAIAPATVAHRYPANPQPTRNVVVATIIRRPASVTISNPYPVQRSSPASMPISVACRQKPARPTASSATESHRDSVNTWPDHSGELTAMTPAADTPTSAATLIGWVRGPVTTSLCPTERTSLVASCNSPNEAPVTRPNAPQNTPNTENPVGSRSRAAR